VSTAQETLGALLTVLEEERAAIRSLDGAAVERTAAAKEELVTKLAANGPEMLAEVAGDLPLIRAELRRNGMLLAHARSCINQVIDMTAPRLDGARRGALRARV
jgi:hypothetical protein